MEGEEQVTIDQIKELAGHRDVSPWVIKLVQDAVEIERNRIESILFDIHPIIAAKLHAALRIESLAK